MSKATIKDYQVLLGCKDHEIALLKTKLENFESLQRVECCECERGAVQELSDLHIKMLPFEDEYFKGLDTKTIAELAKKSIRLGEENSKLETELEELKSTSTISFAELVVLEQEFLAQYSQFKTVTNAFMERIFNFLEEKK